MLTRECLFNYHDPHGTHLFICFQLFFEDEEKETLYQVEPDMSLLKVLQHKRYLFVFIIDSSIAKLV